MDITLLKSVRYNRVGRFFALCTLLLTAGCKPSTPITRLDGFAQGSFYSIQYCDPKQRNLQPLIDSFLSAFDSDASLWVENSLLRQLNSNQTDSLSPVLEDMLRKSLQVHNYTNGAFDCRVGRIVQTWGFSFRQRQEPDSASLTQLLRQAQGDVSVINGRLSKEYPETELDFNAIAQGYSVDALASLFDSLGIGDYLIDIGGEVTARGSKPGNQPWRVGIEKPAADSMSAPIVQTAVALHNTSVVTSGNYRKYYEKNGLRYSHTIDPSTGRPVQHTLLSASVIEKECWLADAMATAYMVMGLEKARDFINSHQGQPGTSSVMLIADSAGSLQVFTTPDFDKLVVNRY